MKKIGLTGGMGCGKSTAVRFFRQYDTPIIDADQIARQLVEPGEPLLQRITKVFGEQIIRPGGKLDRVLLKKQVFAHSHLLHQLESILHPAIRQRIIQQMQQYGAMNIPYIIVDVPLLVEKGYENLFDAVIVVDCEPEQQLERIAKRDLLDKEQITSIIAKQASRKERLEIATETLDNSGSVEALAAQVKALHVRFSR